MPKVFTEQIIDILTGAQTAYSQEAKTTEALLWLKEIERQPDALPPLVHAFLVRILTAKEISLEDRQFIKENKKVLLRVLDYLKNLTKSSFGGTTVGRVTSFEAYGQRGKGFRSGHGKPQR